MNVNYWKGTPEEGDWVEKVIPEQFEQKLELKPGTSDMTVTSRVSDLYSH